MEFRTKSNIKKEWDSLNTITKDIEMYLKNAYAIGGEDLKMKIKSALLKGISNSEK